MLDKDLFHIFKINVFSLISLIYFLFFLVRLLLMSMLIFTCILPSESARLLVHSKKEMPQAKYGQKNDSKESEKYRA